MRQEGVQQISIWQSKMPQDRRFGTELTKHLSLLKEKGIALWSSSEMHAGIHMLEEAIDIASFTSIAILLMSIDFLLDPLIQHITPILCYRAEHSSQKLPMITILLRPCTYHHEFACITPINEKPAINMKPGEREALWVDVYHRVFTLLGGQILLPVVGSVLTDIYLRSLYEAFQKHTDVSTSLFTGSTVGTFNHGLGVTPDEVLLAPLHGQEIGYDHPYATQVRIAQTSPSIFTALAISRKKKP